MFNFLFYLSAYTVPFISLDGQKAFAEPGDPVPAKMKFLYPSFMICLWK